MCSADNEENKPQGTRTLRCYGSYWETDVPECSDEKFQDSFRVDRSTFKILVGLLSGLTRQGTLFHLAPLDKLIAIALYTLGSSAECRTIGRLFGISETMVCKISQEFCNEVIARMASDYLQPNFLTEEKVKDCVNGFEKLGFPQCFGAMAGCHIEVRPKAKEKADFQNCKGWYSTVLFVLVDYRCRFMYVNVGCPGQYNDAQIYSETKLKVMLEETPLFKEYAKKLCGTEVPVVVLGDPAFKFSSIVMKPFPYSKQETPEQSAFNCHFSKARRVIENAFGQLKARFRRIAKGLDNNSLLQTSNVILSCCILHNFFNEQSSVCLETWQMNAVEEKPQPEHQTLLGAHDEEAQAIRLAIGTYLIEK